MMFLCLSVGLCCLLGSVAPHGYLRKPPNRSSMWRYDFEVPPNYNDMGLNCGGTGTQTRLEGKCGICGDPYDATVKENEAGGKYALGVIAGTYESGTIINAEVHITAYHRGYFEFRLCAHNDPSTEVTQDCLDRNLLIVGPEGETKFQIGNKKAEFYNVSVQLPVGVTCTQCVLQWTYTAGNSWGCDAPGDCGKGKGAQENFVNCADITITGDGSNISTSAPPTEALTTTPTIANTAAPTSDTSQSTKPNQTTSSETAQPSTEMPEPVSECRGTGPWKGRDKIDDWCKLNCAMGFCPPSTCTCSPDDEPRLTCRPAGIWGMLKTAMTRWCDANCNHVPKFCPESHCVCDDK